MTGSHKGFMICDLVFGQTERKSDPGRWRGCRVYLPHLSFEHPKNWEVSFTPPWVCYAKMLIAYEIGCFCFFLQKFGGEDPLGERDNASWVAGRKLYLEKSPPLKPMEATVLPPPPLPNITNNNFTRLDPDRLLHSSCSPDCSHLAVHAHLVIIRHFGWSKRPLLFIYRETGWIQPNIK